MAVFNADLTVKHLREMKGSKNTKALIYEHKGPLKRAQAISDQSLTPVRLYKNARSVRYFERTIAVVECEHIPFVQPRQAVAKCRKVEPNAIEHWTYGEPFG